MKYALQVISLSLLLFSLNAQSPTWKKVNLNENIPFSNTLVDSLNFLWLLSDEGLYLYDGINLAKKFEPKRSEESFTSLVLDQDNMLLIGSSESQAYLYDPYEYELISTIHFDDSLNITGMLCANVKDKCVLWSYGNGLVTRHRSENKYITEENGLISNEVYDAIFIADTLLVATDQGLQKFYYTLDSLESIINDSPHAFLDVIQTSIAAKEGEFWVSYFSDSLTLLSSDGMQHFRSDQLDRIEKIRLENGDLYIASDAGLFEIKNRKLSKKYPVNDLIGVRDFSLDQHGNLWILNNKDELLYANFLFQKYDQSLEEIQALQLIEDEIWVGNDQGLFVYTNDTFRNLLNTNVTTIFYHEGYIWLGTYSNGLYILDKKGNVLNNINFWDGFSNQSVLTIFLDAHKIYISSLTGIASGEIIINDGVPKVNFTSRLNPIIGEGYYYQIMMHEDKMYFASDGKGIRTIDQGKVKNYSTFQNGEKIGSVYSMTFDHMDNLWFTSSSQSLGVIKNDTVFRFDQQMNNFDPYSSLMTLKDGKILLVRNLTVDILNPENNEITHFEDEIGISTASPFLNSIDTSGNSVVFSHNNALYRMQVGNDFSIHPNLIIHSALANLNPIMNGQVLRQSENNIQFEYKGSWLTNPGKLTYHYRLQGFDNNWRKTKDRSVSYPKLKPGTYTFEIMVSMGDRFSEKNLTTFDFKIRRHFYTSWWFWLIVVLISAGLFYSWRETKRKNDMKNIEIEKKHIETQLVNLKSQINPHFLFNSFNTLMGLIEENQDRSLVFVEKLTDFYRLVLEQGKSPLIPLKEELKLVYLFTDILNERFENALEININIVDHEILIPPLTLQLLIENAVKHNEVGHHKKLLIEIFEEKDFIVVKNNLALKKYMVKSTGSGLHNIKKRYLLLNSKAIEVEETATYFQVKLPIIQSTQS